MIASHHFFCSWFLECLSIGCWITWINSLIFWSPLSYCPCVFLLYCLGGLHSVDFSCLFLLCFKNCSDLCVGSLPFFLATVSCSMAVSCSFTALKIGWGGVAWRAGEQWFSFVYLFFPALPILLSFFFFSVVLIFHVEHFP